MRKWRRMPARSSCPTSESWDYFARAFKLETPTTIESKPGFVPSPRRVEEVIQLCKADKVRLIVTEPYYDVSIAKLISEQVECRTSICRSMSAEFPNRRTTLDGQLYRPDDSSPRSESKVMPADLLRARGVALGYGGRTVLRNLDFTIERGDFLGVMGPNGSGKTTLLRAMLGLIKLLAGTLEWVAQNGGPPRIGYVPQRERLIRISRSRHWRSR